MKTLILYGIRATGKTSIGKRLAKKLNLPFFDLDKEIEKNVNTPLYEYIKGNGWDVFRVKETEVLKEIIKQNKKAIISLGAGAIITEENRNIISKKNHVAIYIESNIKNIQERIEKDEKSESKRNSLTGKDVGEELEEIYKKRKPIYEKYADIKVENNGSLEECVEEVEKRIKRGKICVPIINLIPDDIKKTFKSIEKKKEISYIELRVDFLKDSKRLKNILKEAPRKCIVTSRIEKEGGNFKGTKEEQIEILIQASHDGAAFIDIELDAGEKIHTLKKGKRKESKLIISFHDFEKTPDFDELKKIIQKMSVYSPDIFKIALMPQQEEDVERIYELSLYCKEHYKDSDFIFISMGELGKETRIKGVKDGGFLTFGTLGRESSAPGQINYKDLYKSIMQ